MNMIAGGGAKYRLLAPGYLVRPLRGLSFWLLLRFEDAAHGAGDAFACVFAEAAHAFAELLASAQDAAARDVPAEPLAAAARRAPAPPPSAYAFGRRQHALTLLPLGRDRGARLTPERAEAEGRDER